MLAALRLSKWLDEYDAQGKPKQAYEPLPNTHFEIYKAGESPENGDTPIAGVTTDFGALARFAQEGVDLMLSDSTNATKRDFTPSEREVRNNLRSIIEQAKGRVVIEPVIKEE